MNKLVIETDGGVKERGEIKRGGRERGVWRERVKFRGRK